MSKNKLGLLAIMVVALFMTTGWITHVNNWWISNSQLTGCEITFPDANYQLFSTGGNTLKSVEMGLGCVSSTAVTVTGGATALACTA